MKAKPLTGPLTTAPSPPVDPKSYEPTSPSTTSAATPPRMVPLPACPRRTVG
jgi:hypothetical protein